MPFIFRQFMDSDGENFKIEQKKQQEKKEQNNSNFDKTVNVNKIIGLTSKQAEKILKKEGENSLISQKNVSIMKIFAGQFKDFLVLILLASTILSIFMGEITEAIVIVIILFMNACMGFLQEYRTEKTLEALDNMVSPNAKILRDNKIQNMTANLIVKNDILFLEIGDCVPADCVVLKSNRFEVDESMLTGETVSVEKKAIENFGKNFENNNLIYMGTSVIKGSAVVKVLKTGMETQIGKIASLINDVQKEQTPIQKKLAQMSAIIVVGCLMAAIFVTFIGILRGEQPFDMIVTGLSLAVASVPEGLPAIVTIALSFAVKHMVKKNALVRKLHAVETLGCADLICTDKTGTITQNKMTVKKVVIADEEFNIHGDGYGLNGAFYDSNHEKVKVQHNVILKKLIQTFVMCNSAKLFIKNNSNDEKINVIGEPTEIALLIAAAKCETFKENLIDVKFQIYDEIPFDSNKKYMMVFAKVKNKPNEKIVFVKGAYDVILNKCSKCYFNNDFVNFSKFEQFFNKKNDEFAKLGMRVLAFAYGRFNENNVSNFENGKNLIFLGLAAMFDPPRIEAKPAVLTCKKAGIKTIMITGDQKLTAISIAKQVGIFKNGDLCVEGKELNKLNELELKKVVEKTTIFARVSPEHKLKIVKALKQNGHIVAMTGDGVNDAAAIKEANIGVAMGKNGSDVTKQAANLILLDDNFSTLVTAVEEGRIIYSNMRKFIRYLLSCNFGEVLTSVFAMLIGMPVPLLPMQILLINLVTDGLPAIALSLEPAEINIMNSKPRSIKETIFSNGLISKILIRGILIALTTLTVFTVIFKQTLSIELARTATFLTLVSSQLIHVFECKSEKKSIFKLNYLNNKKLLAAVGLSTTLATLAIWFKPLSQVLKNYSLTFQQVLVVMAITLIVPVVNGFTTEIKILIKKRKQRIKILH